MVKKLFQALHMPFAAKVQFRCSWSHFSFADVQRPQRAADRNVERNELLGQLRRMHSGPNEAVAHAVAATLAPPARCIKVPRAKELSKVSAKV